MPWKTPPPEVRDAVNRALGGDIYAQAARAWQRAQAADPQVVLESWFRTPEEHFRLPGAARYSQHLIGTAIDLVERDRARRNALIQALRAERFHVIPRGRRVHVQAMNPQEFQSVLPALRAAGLFGR